MALYERLIGLQAPKIAVHQFFGVMQEFALGTMSGAEATAAFGLDAGEQAEAQALLARITAESAANGALARRMKAVEFERVLVVAEVGIAPLDTVAAVKARLGV